MTALPHKFESTIELHDLAQVVGYQSCLADLLTWINEKEKAGYIITKELLMECILATTKELMAVNNLSNEIKSLIKPKI